MSGQDQPPRIVEPFAVNAGVGFKNDIPVTSPDTLAASLDQGFPPSNFLDPADGGVLPSGADFNGILFLVSSWAAYFAAGQIPFFDATLATAMSGYAAGSVLASTTIGQFWIAIQDGLTNDPDSDPTGWRSVDGLLHSVSVLAAGTHTDVDLPGYSDYIIDVDTTAGNVTVNGFVAQYDGQSITWANIGTGQLIIGANVGASANQVRMSSALTALQNDSLTFRWSGALGKWVNV